MITCNDVIKIYSDPDTELKVAALRGLDFKVREGELVSIIGPSGAGKTSILEQDGSNPVLLRAAQRAGNRSSS